MHIDIGADVENAIGYAQGARHRPAMGVSDHSDSQPPHSSGEKLTESYRALSTLRSAVETPLKRFGSADTPMREEAWELVT